MPDTRNSLVYSTGPNWLYERYYYAGSNSRYWTFQMALNLLVQRVKEPKIIETGCQRLVEDLGGGMSTSILGEFCHRNGGHLYTVDLSKENLEVCKQATSAWGDSIEYIHSDSAAWLAKSDVGPVDLLYLDSWDYPYGEILNFYGGQQDLNAAIERLNKVPHNEIVRRHGDIIAPSQNHCLKELEASFGTGKVTSKTIVMIDDNQLPGGGKSRLVKPYLAKRGWICLFDHQQTIWVKEL